MLHKKKIIELKQVEHIKVAQKKEREKKRALKVTKSDQEKLVVIDKWKKTQKSIEKEARKGPKKKKIVKSKRARRQATKDLKMQALREHNQDLAGQDSDSDTESVGLGRS